MICEYIGVSWRSRLIRWFTWRKYSHTSWSDAVVRNGYLVGDTSEWEAWPKNGVEHVPMVGMNHTVGTRIDLYELRTPLNREEKEAGMLFLSTQLKKLYDWWGIMGFAFRARTQSDSRWFCSELVFTFLRKCGRTILQCTEAYQTTPGMIETSLEVNPVIVGYLIVGEDLKVHQDIESETGLSGILKLA